LQELTRTSHFGDNLTAPAVTNIFQEEGQGQKLNVNFSDLVNYLALRNNGTSKWDTIAWDGSGMNAANRIFNGDFEMWANGTTVAPDGWELVGAAATIARESTIVKISIRSAKLTRAGTDCSLKQYPISTLVPNYIQGRTFTLGCWVYATVASRALITINDGVGATSSSYHTGNSTWQFLTVTRTLSSSATTLVVQLEVVAGNTSAYFDGATIIEGATPFAFQPKPLNYGGNTISVGNGYVGIGIAVPEHLLDVYGESVGGNSPGIAIANTASPTTGETYLIQMAKWDDGTLDKIAVLHALILDDDATSGYALEDLHVTYRVGGVSFDDHSLRCFGGHGVTFFWDSDAAPGDKIVKINNGYLWATPTTNQLILGTTRTVTLNAPTPATASRVYTMPDIGAAATFSYLEGTQVFSGAKDFSSALGLSSGQITFPATQVPSAGANVLDDYEEGTWTMGIAFGGGSTGATYNASYITGLYTKIGRVVHAQGYLILTAKGSSTGDATVTGLPFTSQATDGRKGAVTLRLQNITYANAFQGYVEANSTVINLEEIDEAGNKTSLTDADFADNSRVMVQATYFV
jgi:hypothetical protein